MSATQPQSSSRQKVRCVGVHRVMNDGCPEGAPSVPESGAVDTGPAACTHGRTGGIPHGDRADKAARFRAFLPRSRARLMAPMHRPLRTAAMLLACAALSCGRVGFEPLPIPE